MVFETLAIRKERAALFVEIAAPPMNLFGPELVRDLGSLIHQAEADPSVRVLVFKSADRDYFISHVDLTRVKELGGESAKLDEKSGRPPVPPPERKPLCSRSPAIERGRARGGLRRACALACDMRFAARVGDLFGRSNCPSEVIPARAGVQHLTTMGRAGA